jgi:hypothetical protein
MRYTSVASRCQVGMGVNSGPRTRNSMALLAFTAMTEQSPVAGPEALRVGLGRSNAVVTVLLLGFLGWVVWAGAHGAWTSTETSARVLGVGFAVAFAIPLVMLLRFLPRFLSPRYVVVDEAGVAIQQGKQTVVVAWHEVTAIGIGYEIEPPTSGKIPNSLGGLTDAAKGYLADQVSEALQISGKRRLVLEIFPVRPDAVDLVPRLKPYWKSLPPPAAGLPEWGWRFPLPPVVSIAQQIAGGLRSRAPRHWLGWFERPWSATK